MGYFKLSVRDVNITVASQAVTEARIHVKLLGVSPNSIKANKAHPKQYVLRTGTRTNIKFSFDNTSIM